MKNNKDNLNSLKSSSITSMWIRRGMSVVAYFTFSLCISGIASAEEVIVETDRTLCEGESVIVSATAPECVIGSISWQKLLGGTSIMNIDGTKDDLQLEGDTLETEADGTYRAILSCDDGRVLEGEGQVLQETDDSKC